MALKKKALVTGANKGIGYAIAKELIAKNYEVWIGARNKELGSKAAEEIGAHFLSLEVTDGSSIANAAKLLAADVGALDLLVNNAGVALGEADGMPTETQIEAVKKTMDVNFYGPIRVIQAFLPLLEKSKDAQILTISSGMGSQTLLSDPSGPLDAYPKFIGYSASKAAVNTLTILLAKELKNIRVNSICPGAVKTDMSAGLELENQLLPDRSAQMIVNFIERKEFTTGQFAQEHGTYPW
jgi:NAD(P)-dependent dehydrogenase (short-subunit alcohol dehydrogenase family)